MSKRLGIEYELTRLAEVAPAGQFIGLHIRFAAPLVSIVTYPDAWQRHYNAQAYQLRDPMVAWGFSAEGALRWSEIVAELPDPFGVFDQAAEHGLTHGMCCSHGPMCSRTIVSAARSDRPFTDAEIAEIVFLVRRMHRVTEPPASLTTAQVEALRRVADGDRHSAAADALGISVSAFKARLAAARERLLCRTTAETLQKAREFGLM